LKGQECYLPETSIVTIRWWFGKELCDEKLNNNFLKDNSLMLHFSVTQPKEEIE